MVQSSQPRERDLFKYQPPISTARQLWQLAGCDKRQYKELLTEMLETMRRIMRDSGADTPTEALLMLGANSLTPRVGHALSIEEQLEILETSQDDYEGW